MLECPFHFFPAKYNQAAGIPAIDAQLQKQFETCLVYSIRQVII
jgi:hypothetical protein